MIKVEDITTKEDVLANLQAKLAHAKERKKVYGRVRAVLEEMDKKKLTKAIEKKFETVLPGYLISFYVECHDKKVAVRRRHGGNKEVFSENIHLHSANFGDYFSFSRFLDGDTHTAAFTAQIMELEQSIRELDALYPLFIAQVLDFVKVQQQFKQDMKEFQGYLYSLSTDEREFIIEHTRW